MKYTNNNKSAYSVIASLLIIGFLLVLTIGIFNLLLNDLKDNKAMGDYIKSYAGAESAQELALLKIKENGYAYYDKVEHDINERSIVLSSNPLDKSLFNPNKDIFISYDIGSKVHEYEGTLNSLEYDIVPLFYINDNGEQKVSNIDFSISFGTDTDLAWNIIGKNNGLSGVGTNTLGVKKVLTSDGFKYDQQEINSFLANSDTNYLILLNSGNSGIIKYKIKSTNNSELFTSPKTSIISSAQVGNYKQNLSTDLNNTEFLNILKYSIYSN